MSQTQHVADPTSNVLALSQQKSKAGISLLARTGTILGLLSLAINIIWIIFVPPLRGPDEAAHLMAVMEVRTLGRLPEIHYDFGADPRGAPVPPYDDVRVAAYAQRLGVPDGAYSVRYESYQPPLYYLASALLALPFPSDPQTVLFVSKLVAAIFGALTVYFLWASIRQLVPNEPLLALLCAGSTALLPVFAYIGASANNDSLLNAACAALFYVCVRGLNEPEYDPYLLKAGILTGVGLLAKLTILTLLPALALVLLFKVLDSSHEWGPRLRRLRILSLSFTSTVLLVAGWWLVRNLIVYGEISGSAGALAWSSTRQAHGDLSSLEKIGDFLSSTFTSFVGLFGWDATLFPLDVYIVAEAVALTLVLLSFMMFVNHMRHGMPVVLTMKRNIAILGLASVGAIAGYVQYSVAVAYQPQARYLFPLLVPISLVLLAGLYVLARKMKSKFATPILLGTIPGLLGVLNYMAIALLSST